MEVLGIGNVTEVNYLYIHLNNEGKQERIAANKERLVTVRDTALADMKFYERMGEVSRQYYEERKKTAEEKYHYITDEMVKEAYKESYSKGFDLSIYQSSNNEEYIRQFASVFGLYDLVKLASDRYWEAHKLEAQAKNGLKQIASF